VKFLIRLLPASGTQQDAKLELDADFLSIGFAKDNGLVLEIRGPRIITRALRGKTGNTVLKRLPMARCSSMIDPSKARCWFQGM